MTWFVKPTADSAIETPRGGRSRSGPQARSDTSSPPNYVSAATRANIHLEDSHG